MKNFSAFSLDSKFSIIKIFTDAAFVREIIQKVCPNPRLRVPRQRKRKAESAAVLTSSPYKDTLHIRDRKKQRKEDVIAPNKGKCSVKGNGKGKKKVTSKGKDNKKIKTHEADKSEDEEWPCLIWVEPWAHSRPNEIWVQCLQCHKWAHEECTSGSPYFICPNCESDVSSNEDN